MVGLLLETPEMFPPTPVPADILGLAVFQALTSSNLADGPPFQMLRFGSRFIFKMLEPDKNLHWQCNERRDRFLSHPKPDAAS
jgi:hypothetical protein